MDRVSHLDRVSAYILFLAIAAAPLPQGTRDLATVAAWCFVLGIGLLCASPRKLRRGQLSLIGGIVTVVACYGLVLHEQLSDSQWIAAPNPIWARTAELLGRPVEPSVSAVRGEAFFALGRSLAALLALILGLVIGADNDRARQALLVMGWSGAGYAAYGIAQLTNGVATATFVNRNTAAAYFGSCAAVWLVLLMSTVRRRLPGGPIVWGQLTEHLTAEASSESNLTFREIELISRFCLLFLCLTAMFMTTSRAGVGISLVAMVGSFALFFRRDLPSGVSFVLLLAFAGGIAWLLLQLLGGQVEGRVDVLGLEDAGRAAAYQSTLRMIADSPWFGTGLGTFPWVFPAYRNGNISIIGTWDIAHSTPLELAAELGVPMALLIVSAWIAALAVLFRGTSRSRRRTVAPLAALTVALIANVHSTVDFSLQVSGYAIVVFALVGVGLAQSFDTDTSRIVRRARRREEQPEYSE